MRPSVFTSCWSHRRETNALTPCGPLQRPMPHDTFILDQFKKAHWLVSRVCFWPFDVRIRIPGPESALKQHVENAFDVGQLFVTSHSRHADGVRFRAVESSSIADVTRVHTVNLASKADERYNDPPINFVFIYRRGQLHLAACHQRGIRVWRRRLWRCGLFYRPNRPD